MSFPNTRLQRYRRDTTVRELVAENRLNPADFVMPIFIHEGINEKQAINSLPGIFQHTLESLKQEIDDIQSANIKAVMLFGIPTQKDPLGKEAYNPNGIIQKAIRQIKQQSPNMIIIVDCCLCEYTDHGHCGVMDGNQLENDKTLDLLQKTALTYAQSGADCIAPSGMMDGMVQAIRNVLDTNNFNQVSIMSYAVKYASQLYGPFREAAGSQDNFAGDRNHHQLQVSQRREAIREAILDEQEGADYLMVKPASLYLDIIRDLREETLLPLAAYHVSGEYAMIKKAAQEGLCNEQAMFEETFLSLKRAGVDLIITYYAKKIGLHLSK